MAEAGEVPYAQELEGGGMGEDKACEAEDVVRGVDSIIDVVHGFVINQVDIQRGEIRKCGFWIRILHKVPHAQELEGGGKGEDKACEAEDVVRGVDSIIDVVHGFVINHIDIQRGEIRKSDVRSTIISRSSLLRGGCPKESGDVQ